MRDQPTAALRRSPLERDVTLPMPLVASLQRSSPPALGVALSAAALGTGGGPVGPAGVAGERGPNPIEDVGRLAGVAVDEVARLVGPERPGELELDEAQRVLFAGV